MITEDEAVLRSALFDARQERDEARAALSIVEENFREAEAERELMRPVVEAARAYRHQGAGGGHLAAKHRALFAAVDTYETQTGGTE